jgi:hypothetical protein
MKARLTLLVALAVSLLCATATRAETARQVISVSITYEVADVYAGRLENARAAFSALEAFFESEPFSERRTFSFLRDVLNNTMLPDDGFVMTAYGFGYGACGAPSLLNHLVQTATFRAADGSVQAVWQARAWTRERSRVYGRHGVAIYLDLTGARQKDYKWRLNPLYSGDAPRLWLAYDDSTPGALTVTLTMEYDEP